MNKKSPLAFENQEFLRSREARSLRILSEYLEPEKRLKENGVSNTVVFFGSARIHPDNNNSRISKYYNETEELSYRLAVLSEEIKKTTGEKYYICTGGGPGIMEAANRGALRAGEKTIGLNIELPFEQEPNPYISPELNFEFHYFFTRKLWFLYHTKAIIVMPGGFGTMDELFETLTLLQTRKLQKENLPVVLYGKEFWREVVNFEKLVEYGLICPEDVERFEVVDTVDEAVDEAASNRSLILWASVYGFWVAIGLGVILLLLGFLKKS